jgi:hypothetical protein
MAFCPNLSDPNVKLEFDLLKNKVGENIAYYLWDKHEGDIEFIYAEIAVREKEALERQMEESDERVKEAIDKYGKEITDVNNPYTWDFEKKHNLVTWKTLPDGTKRKISTKYTYGAASARADMIRQEGGLATVRPVYVKRNTTKYWVVIPKYKIGRPDTKARTNFYEYREHDQMDIELLNFYAMESGDAFDIMNHMRDKFPMVFHQHGLDKWFHLFMKNKDKLGKLPVRVGALTTNSDDAVMTFDGREIAISQRGSIEESNVEHYIMGFVHEVVHAFTVQAIDNPISKADKDFRDAILKIQKAVLNDIDKFFRSADPAEVERYLNVVLKDPAEMVAYAFNEPSFRAMLEQIDVDGRSAFKRFIDSILELFGLKETTKPDSALALIKENLEVFLAVNDSFNQGTNDGAIIRSVSKKGSTAKPGDAKSIRDALKAIAKDFVFDEDAHTYYHTPTGEYFTSATTLMKEYGYGIPDELTDEQNARLKRASNLGNAVHLTMEGHVKDVVANIQEQTGFTISDDAKMQLKSYLETLKKDSKSVIAMSEVLVADPETKRAGTVDLILIDDIGRVRIFDLKNKEKGFRYYQSEKFGHSDQTKYRLQLSIYKHMIEKTLGIQVYDMNVVHLRPTERNGEIIKVAWDKSYDSSGIDNFNSMSSQFKRIYGEKPVKFNKRRLAEKMEVDDQSSYFDYQMQRQKVTNEELSDVEELAEKAKEALMRRYEIVQSKYSFTQRREFEEFMDELLEIDTATDTLLSIIEYSAKVTNNLLAEHDALREKGEDYTVRMLNKWKDYLMAYESLGQIQEMIMKDKTLFKDPKIVSVLDKTIKNRNFLMGLYKSEGRRLIAEWLTPHYNGVRREMRDKLEAEYRRQIRKKKMKGMSKEDITKELGTQDEFVERLIKERDIDLDRDTFELLYKELSVAGRDIGDLARWMDNMLDTPDPVAAAMVDAFVEADDRSRIEAIQKRTEILRQLRDLERAKNKGNFQSELDFYSFALEFEEGKPTQYLIKPWKSELLREERDMRVKLYKDFTRAEAEAKMTAWRRAHLTLNEEDYNDALNAYLIEQLKYDNISQNDYDNIMRNQLVTHLPMQSLVKEEQISEQAAELALQWMGENRWKYSEVIEKFRNPAWNKWMESMGIDPKGKQFEQIDAVEKSNHPEAKFYTFLNELAREADSMLPYSHRLGHRLPGVAKIKSERIKEGQDPLTFAKETFKAGIFVRPEDTERGNKEFTDENGNPKYFLPIHYTADIELQNQSFDLAGIYYRYWESSNDYRHKRNIISELEMAKFFVDTRSAMKRNAMGDIIKRAASTVGIGDQDERKDEPSLISKTKLADQLNDWFEMAVYGRKSKDSSIVNIWGKELDVSKLIDGLTNFTSMNLLSLNVVQGTANAILGETMQAIDAFAGEHVSAKSLTLGTDYYMRNLHKMMGDVAARNNSSTASLLIENFDILHNNPAYDTVFSKKSRVGQLLDTGTLYFVQEAGEHWMQSRFLFAMLKDKRALDKDGNDIGSLLDKYYSDNGKLKIHKDVDLEKSKWTERDQQVFKRKVKGLLSRMHGEYSDLGRVALQRMALGRMAYQFRKFIMPGWKRRWSGRRYIQRLDQFTEGNYITTGRFVKELVKDMKILNLALMSEEWASLSPHEKANVKRTAGELAFLAMTIVLASAIFSMDGDDEDEWFTSFMAYQLYRFQSELMFFVNPGDAMKILRSPMASMSVIENIGKFIDQSFSPGERYERGPWKGELKIKRTMVNFVPIYKQYYRARDVDQQITFFRN